jgi:DNA polymerase elongation subunit (family B)
VGEMVDFLMKTRKVAKNQMFDLMRDGRSPDDPEVKVLDQRQKIFKLLANSFYGAKSFQVL